MTVVNSRLVLSLVVKRFLVKSAKFKFDNDVVLSSLSLSLCFERLWSLFDCGVEMEYSKAVVSNRDTLAEA